MSCLTSRRPVVGIIGNSHAMNDRYFVHASGTMNSEAVADVAGCLPLIIPTDPRYVSVDDLLDLCDGFLLTGGRPNVHPSEYGAEETPAHGAFDRGRDAVVLPLIRACVDRGQPVLGIGRGFQEVNVALGGSLHPEIRDLPGRMNHRMPPEGTLEEQFALRHAVRFTEGGVFHRLLGAAEVMTNTLHGQGIDRPGPRIVVEGTARITIDGDTRLVSENQSVYIPLGAVHRMENPGKLPMVLIEVQTGAYLGEDDIIRYEDVYARG